MIEAALATQREEIAETGKGRRLGEILLERRTLTPAQVRRILAWKGLDLARSESRGEPSGVQAKGGRGSRALLDSVAELEVAGDVVDGAGRLDVLELGEGDAAPDEAPPAAKAADDDLQTTRRKFTSFYEREKIDLGDAGADEVASDGAPVESRRREARVEASRRLQKRGRLLPGIAAGVLLAFGLVGIGGHFLTRSEPAPRVAPAAPLAASESGPVLAAGDRVVALGNVPPGATVERSGTILFLSDGHRFRIDDPSGRHAEVLARVAERRADPRARVLLRVRGVLRGVPEGRILPPDVHPELSIEVESIEEIRGDELSGSRSLEIDPAR